MEFENNMAFYRRIYNVSRKELGAKLGISFSTISRLEEGKQSPSYAHVILLSRFFSIPSEDLFYPSGETRPFHLPEDLSILNAKK